MLFVFGQLRQLLLQAQNVLVIDILPPRLLGSDLLRTPAQLLYLEGEVVHDEIGVCPLRRHSPVLPHVQRVDEQETREGRGWLDLEGR